jgi:hypothetical protein
MDLPVLVRMRLEIGVPREALELVDLLPPLLAPTVLLVLRMMVLRVRVGKITAVTKLQDLVHRDQRTKRKLKENLVLFLELTLVPHRLQEESKIECLLVSLGPQDEINQIRPATKKKRVRTSRLSQCQ